MTLAEYNRNRVDASWETWERAYVMRKAGRKLWQIAEAMGVIIPTVARYIRRYEEELFKSRDRQPRNNSAAQTGERTRFPACVG